jgi:hypothetical protein
MSPALARMPSEGAYGSRDVASKPAPQPLSAATARVATTTAPAAAERGDREGGDDDGAGTTNTRERQHGVQASERWAEAGIR